MMDTFCQIGDSAHMHVKLEKLIFTKSLKLFFQIDNFCFRFFFKVSLAWPSASYH